MIKKVVLVFIVAWSFAGFGDTSIRMDVARDTISTGEIVGAKLVVDSAAAQSFPIQSLRGQSLADTIYVQSVSPLVHREGENDYTADAEVVFLKASDKNEVTADVASQKIRFYWNNVRINSTEVPKDYILGVFTIPDPTRLLLWGAVALVLMLLLYSGIVLRKKMQMKAALRANRISLKEKVQSCRNYSDVVEMWKSKKIILQTFPHAEEAFSRLEVVLFKYQFKPIQTSYEEQQVMDAYRRFITEVEGGFRGI